MTMPDVTQQDIDSEIEAIEELRAKIAATKAERERTAAETAQVAHAEQLKAERARLEAELEAELALTDRAKQNTTSDALAAMAAAAAEEAEKAAADAAAAEKKQEPATPPKAPEAPVKAPEAPVVTKKNGNGSTGSVDGEVK